MERALQISSRCQFVLDRQILLRVGLGISNDRRFLVSAEQGNEFGEQDCSFLKSGRAEMAEDTELAWAS